MRITLLTLILAAGISSGRATVFTSDGSDTSVQAINNSPNCHDGDTITLPAGTFTWTKGIKLTKGDNGCWPDHNHWRGHCELHVGR